MKISKRELNLIIDNYLFEQVTRELDHDQEGSTKDIKMSGRKPASEGSNKIGLQAIPINVGHSRKVFSNIDSGVIVGTLIDKRLGDMFLINFPGEGINWEHVTDNDQKAGLVSKVEKSDIDIAYGNPKKYSYKRLYQLFDRGTLVKTQVKRTKVGGESEQLAPDRYKEFQKQWDHLEEEHPYIALGIRILDPSGVTGWMAFAESYADWKSESGIMNKHTVSLIINLIGIIPIVKAAGVIKVPGVLSRLRKAKDIQKAVDTGNKTKILGAIGESVSTVNLQKLFGSTDEIQELFLYLNKSQLPPAVKKIIKDIADNPDKLKSTSEAIWSASIKFDKANKIGGHILYPIKSGSEEIMSDIINKK